MRISLWTAACIFVIVGLAICTLGTLEVICESHINSSDVGTVGGCYLEVVPRVSFIPHEQSSVGGPARSTRILLPDFSARVLDQILAYAC